MKYLLNIVFAAALGLIGVGCGAAIDCANICDEYGDCLEDQGGNIDVTQCADRCRDQADDNEPFQQAADDCETCLDSNENMCMNCGQQCNVFLSIVAQSRE